MSNDTLDKPTQKPEGEEENTKPLFSQDDSNGVYDDGFERSKKLPKDDESEKPSKSLTPDELEEAENSAGLSEPSLSSPEEESLYKPDAPKKKGLLSGKSKRNFAIAGAAGGGMLLLLVLVVFFFLNSLKIPHLAENIGVYQFARVSRIFRQSAAQTELEKVALDSADDGFFSGLKEKYGGVRNSTWGKLDKYRPQKVYENLKATGEIKYTYSEPQGFFDRPKLQSVTIAGEEITANSSRFLKIFENRGERIRFSAELAPHLDKSLRGYKSLVRGSVASKIRQDLGIKLHWWEKKGELYKALNEAEADRLALKEAYDKIASAPEGDTAVADIRKTADEAKAKLDACVNNPECVGRLNENRGDLDQAIKDTIASGLKESSLEKIVGIASTIYSIGLPVCLIFEGSLENSGPTINNSSSELQKSYYSVATAADQQKKGETTGKAVGAFNRKLGDISQSNPIKRASGGSIDNSGDVKPQASATGDYTIADALFPAAVSSILNSILKPICPVITDVKTGIVLGITETVLAFFSGGSSKGAEETAALTVRTFVEKIAAGFIKLSAEEIAKLSTAKLYLKFGKSLIYKFARDGALIGGATFLARQLVLQKIGAPYGGLATDAVMANQAEMGGNLHAQEIGRQQFYGRPMSTKEIAQSNLDDIAYINQQQSSSSVFNRYFAVKNPFSLVSKMGLKYSGVGIKSIGSAITNALSKAFNVTGFITSIFSNRPVLAAVSDNNYGIVQWGWSDEENNLIENDVNYYPLKNTQVLEDSGSKDEIAKKYDPCFTLSMGELLADVKIERDSNGAVIDNPDKLCSPINLGLKNPDYKDLVFRYRLEMRNNNTIDHMTSLQGNQ